MITRALSLLLVGLGAAIIVRTIAEGVGGVGLLLGTMLVLAGAFRFYLTGARR